MSSYIDYGADYVTKAAGVEKGIQLMGLEKNLDKIDRVFQTMGFRFGVGVDKIRGSNENIAGFDTKYQFVGKLYHTLGSRVRLKLFTYVQGLSTFSSLNTVTGFLAKMSSYRPLFLG